MDADLITILTVTCLLVCLSCTCYLLGVVFRLIAWGWTQFCAGAMAADRWICRWTGNVPLDPVAVHVPDDKHKPDEWEAA